MGVEVGFRHPIDVVDRRGGNPVTLEEPQPPVAEGRGRGERLGHRGGIGDRVVVAALRPDLRPIELLGSKRRFPDLVGDPQKHLLRLFELPLGRLGHEGEQPGIVGVVCKGTGAGGDGGLDEILLEPPDLVFREDACEHRERGPVGMGRGRHVVSCHHRTNLADAAQDHRPLAVLGRLFGVGGIQPPRRLRDRAEVFHRQFEDLRRLELPRHDEHDVVRLVEALVEVAEVVDRHALDVGAVPDR